MSSGFDDSFTFKIPQAARDTSRAVSLVDFALIALMKAGNVEKSCGLSCDSFTDVSRMYHVKKSTNEPHKEHIIQHKKPNLAQNMC